MKKFLYIIVAFCLLFYVWQINNKPVFSFYEATDRCYYLNSNSSDAKIIKENAFNGLIFNNNIKGESVVLKDKIDVEQILKDFDATLKKVEVLEDSTNYYAYTSKIKFITDFNGTSINLHISVREDSVKLGSPIIFGAY